MNPGKWAPKPENAPLNDLLIRVIMIPAFGIVIPNLTGYFGPLTWRDGKYWAGLLWGTVISFTIWHGNRFLLLKQRQHLDWFRYPVRKIAVLLFACIFYTAPCSVLMMLGWYSFAGFGPDWQVIRTATLACIICVAFITHVYETVFLIQQRESDMLAVGRLERARTQAELEALKTQVAPHFLFNSLNTLAWLIENSPDKALSFNQDLAEVYRYILLAGRREIVPLEEEWAFLKQYCALLQLRFEDSLYFDFEEPGDRLNQWYLPPISLQVLVENAVKHNEHSPHHPLQVRVQFGDDYVAVSNDRRPRSTIERSARTGLRTLSERCQIALGRPIELLDEGELFIVQVPVRRS